MGLMEVGSIGGHSSDSIEDILGDKGAPETWIKWERVPVKYNTKNTAAITIMTVTINIDLSLPFSGFSFGLLLELEILVPTEETCWLSGFCKGAVSINNHESNLSYKKLTFWFSKSDMLIFIAYKPIYLK